MIDISESAQRYLRELLSKQDDADVGIRVFVAQPGTPHAETCIAYCRPGEEQEGDIPVGYDGFTAWFEERSAPYLALLAREMDLVTDAMSGERDARGRLLRPVKQLHFGGGTPST